MAIDRVISQLTIMTISGAMENPRTSAASGVLVASAVAAGSDGR